MSEAKPRFEEGCFPPRIYEKVPGGVLVWSATSAKGWTSTFLPGVGIRRLSDGTVLVHQPIEDPLPMRIPDYDPC